MRKEGEENESSLEGNNGMKIRMTIMGTIIHAICIIKEYQEELYSFGKSFGKECHYEKNPVQIPNPEV